MPPVLVQTQDLDSPTAIVPAFLKREGHWGRSAEDCAPGGTRGGDAESSRYAVIRVIGPAAFPSNRIRTRTGQRAPY